MKVKLKKLNENVKLPVYAKTGDAGLDIKATRIESENNYSITYGTDLCIEIPFGYVGLVFPRSSVRNYDLILSNCVAKCFAYVMPRFSFTVNNVGVWLISAFMTFLMMLGLALMPG